MSLNNINNNIEIKNIEDNCDEICGYDEADMLNLYDIWLEQHEEDGLYYEEDESCDE